MPTAPASPLLDQYTEDIARRVHGRTLKPQHEAVIAAALADARRDLPDLTDLQRGNALLLAGLIINDMMAACPDGVEARYAADIFSVAGLRLRRGGTECSVLHG